MPNLNTENFPQPPILRRQLSASYTNPLTGEQTSDDPSSYQGAERTIFEDALLQDLSNTGYADGIRSTRHRTRRNHPLFLGSCKDVFFQPNHNNHDDSNSPGAASIPVMA